MLNFDRYTVKHDTQNIQNGLLKLDGLGVHFKVPIGVWGGNGILCILALKSDTQWHQFY